MIETVVALFCRIFSNPIANLVQKQLAQKYSAILINLYSYLILSLFCVFINFLQNGCSIVQTINSWSVFGLTYWVFAVSAGILCTLGSVCLIKALQYGDMSVLGPINSYKCIVGLVFGILLLKEIPSVWAICGMLLIILGSWVIFDTQEEGIGFKLFMRKDIVLRFCALFFTGCEAVVLKKIILMSSVMQSFILWCILGFIFSLVLMFIFKIKIKLPNRSEILKCFIIALCLGIMQYSTNFVFERMNVGLSLALFQLSGLVAVWFGYKFFREKHLLKKSIGSVIMLIGSSLILLL